MLAGVICMKYHLHDGGKDLGVFSLEELRSRRRAGGLNGQELVWCEGMNAWETLDSVLYPHGQRKLSALVVVAIVAGALAVLVGATFVGIRAARLARLRLGPRGFAGQEASALSIASAPIIWNSHTLTAADVQKKRGEFRERQYLESYKKFGRHDSPADADGQRLINSWLIYNYGTPAERTNLPSLAELSDKLASDPACDDPVVLSAAGACSVELHEEVRRFERAVAGFQNSRYPGYPKFYATVHLCSKLIKDRVGREPELDASAMQYLKQALGEGSVRPEDQDDIGDVLIMGWGRSFFDRNAVTLYQMVERQGKSFRWLALVLRGEYEIEKAWQARGGGYADTVSQQGWNGFRDHLANARTYLAEAWKLHPEWPLAADRMMRVSLGDSDLQEMRLWFDRATEAQIDYADAWSELRWGLRPRWYGDTDSMLAFGIAALNTKRFDTDVPRKFFDSISDIQSELQLPQGEHIYGREDIWPHFQVMYEGYIGDPRAGYQDGWRENYSIVAYFAGKYSVAGAQLKALNWNVSDRSLSGWHTDLSLMPQEVAARTGPLGSRIDEAEAARRDGDVSRALQLYQGLSHEAGADQRTGAFIQDRLKTLEVEQQLQSGNWVDMLPADTNFTGWHIERGRFQLLPDGSLEVQSGENGHVLYSRARVGKSFEVRGEIEKVRSSTADFQGGVVIGLPQPDTWDWDAFRLKRNGDEGNLVAFSEGWSATQVFFPVKLNDETNSFDLRFELNRITASVNGQQVFKDIKPPQNWQLTTNEMHFGLGAFNDINKTTMRYRNIQVRQLSAD